MNLAILVGRLGSDCQVDAYEGGKKRAVLSVATDASYKDRQTDKWVNRADWHRVVCWNTGFIDKVLGRAKKGSLVEVVGKLRTGSWDKDGEIRYTTEILLDSGSRFRVLLLPDGKNPEPQKTELQGEGSES